MNKNALVFGILLSTAMAVLLGCKGKYHGIKPVTSDTARFYPINAYIMQQIERVDSAAVFIYKITVANGRRDSAVLDKRQFNQLAQTFLEYDISDKKIHDYYKESVFLDENTHSYTFNYTAADSSMPVQSVNILLSVDTPHVKWVFVNKVKISGVNTHIEKAGWKNDDSFFINRISETPNGENTEHSTVFWRNEH